jgi:hypothetical protein
MFIYNLGDLGLLVKHYNAWIFIQEEVVIGNTPRVQLWSIINNRLTTTALPLFTNL